jgi:hypothetical protein
MLLTPKTLAGVWLTITAPLPVIFINVASKGLRVNISGLESTFAGWFVSVASKWVREGVVWWGFLPRLGESKGEKRRKTIIAELLRDAEDAELRSEEGAEVGMLAGAGSAALAAVGKSEATQGRAVLWARRGHRRLRKVRFGITDKEPARMPAIQKEKPRERRGRVLNEGIIWDESYNCQMKN